MAVVLLLLVFCAMTVMNYVWAQRNAQKISLLRGKVEAEFSHLNSLLHGVEVPESFYAEFSSGLAAIKQFNALRDHVKQQYELLLQSHDALTKNPPPDISDLTTRVEWLSDQLKSQRGL